MVSGENTNGHCRFPTQETLPFSWQSSDPMSVTARVGCRRMSIFLPPQANHLHFSVPTHVDALAEPGPWVAAKEGLGGWGGRRTAGMRRRGREQVHSVRLQAPTE